MSKQHNALLCLTLAVILALSACACGSRKKPQPEASNAVPVTTSQPAATAATAAKPQSTTPIFATADSVRKGDEAVSYNSMEIKKNIDEIDAKLESIVADQHYAGVLYVKFGNDFETVKEKGIANKGAHKNNSIHTGMFTGSVTKLVTATAIMKLAEEQALDISATIDKYFPDCAYAKDVTIEQLLRMTAGIPDYVQNDDSGERLLKPVPALEKELKAENSAEQNKNAVLRWILSQPREKTDGSFQYANSEYFLLGDIIAQASGKPYEEYVRETIFDPLMMSKTLFAEGESTARPYIGDEQSGLLMLDGAGYSSLGMMADVSDVLKLTDGLVHHQIITEASFQKMTADSGSGFGYGVYVNGNRVTVFGEIDAYSAKLSFTTDSSHIFVGMTNDVHSDPDAVHRLFKEYLEKYRN